MGSALSSDIPSEKISSECPFEIFEISSTRHSTTRISAHIEILGRRARIKHIQYIIGKRGAKKRKQDSSNNKREKEYARK